jgi:hypothetical protein
MLYLRHKLERIDKCVIATHYWCVTRETSLVILLSVAIMLGEIEIRIMLLSNGDLFALIIALVLGNTALILAFRRVYVLEQRVKRLGGR